MLFVLAEVDYRRESQSLENQYTFRVGFASLHATYSKTISLDQKKN
ncbi:MAG: hypothetical protein V4665_03215 [Patescibacteria group bacterium]